MPDKTERVYRYQHATVAEAQRLIASMGLSGPEELSPHHLMRRVDHINSSSYAELYEWLSPDELLGDDASRPWSTDWNRADPDSFKARRV